MNYRISVQVAARLAQALHEKSSGESDHDSTAEIGSKPLDVELSPMHPGTSDPLLMPWFTIEVPDLDTAEEVAESLRQHADIEAAFVKPPDEMP